MKKRKQVGGKRMVRKAPRGGDWNRDLSEERGAMWLRWWYGRGVFLGKDNNFPEYLSCTRPYSRSPGESKEQYC